MALMKTLILALCIGHSAVLELPPRRRARLFSYMWCWVLLGHFPSLRCWVPKGRTWFHRDRDHVSHPFTLVLMFAVIRREPSSEA